MIIKAMFFKSEVRFLKSTNRSKIAKLNKFD